MSILAQLLNKKDSKEYFIALGIEENFVRAAVVELDRGKATILGTGKSEFKEDEKETDAADMAITQAEKTVAAEVTVEKVIFALPQIYLDGDNVKPEYLIRLKTIAQELNLKPVGFIDYSSAIAFYLGEEEGTAPTVLLLDLTKKHLILTLIRVGKIIGQAITERTDDIKNDFGLCLPQFTDEMLPSRIILFDGPGLKEELKDELLKFPWHKHSIFLHTPKIEIMNNERLLKAFVEASSTSFLPKSYDINMETVEATKNEEEKVAEDNKETKPKRQEIIETENFGFVTSPIHEDSTAKAGRIKEKPQTEKKRNLKNIILSLAGKLKGFKFTLPKLALPGGGILLPAFVLLILAAGFGIYYLFNNYPKAEVMLITYPMPQENTAEILFTKEGNEGTGENQIAVKAVNAEASGKKEAKTTGTALIGDRAKGEVTVYNKTTSSRTLPKGSILSSGSIKFTLDGEVKLASASDTGEGITFGKTSVKITAQNIGTEGNLKPNSTFQFAEFADSTFNAKNTQALTGGTSREIPSVSKEDRDKLTTVLINELATQAKKEVTGQIALGERILDEPISKEITAKKFSADIGEEAHDVTLEMTIKIEALTYQEKDLLALGRNNITAPLGDYQLDKNQIGIRVGKTKTDKNGNITAEVTLTSYFLPQFDLTKIREDLKGKTYLEAQDYLNTYENIGGVKIYAVNKFPFFDKRLPQRRENINLIVSSR